MRRLNLAITYQLFFEQTLFNTTRQTVHHIHLIHIGLVRLALHYEVKVRHLRWIITVKVGYNILFNRSTHWQMSALLNVYDGSLGEIQIFSITLKLERTSKQRQRINTFSSYMQVTVTFDIYNLIYLDTSLFPSHHLDLPPLPNSPHLPLSLPSPRPPSLT